MPKLESIQKLLRRWFTSIPFFVLLGLILGLAIAFPVIPRPKIAVVPISGVIIEQDYADSILDILDEAWDDDSIKAVVLQIDSPGGGAPVIEQIYLDVLRLRERKPVVAFIGARGASGGYYVAVASNFIYAQQASQVGNVGASVSLPGPARLDEDTLTTGLFKSTGGSRRKAAAKLEMVRQQFVSAVISQRGDRLKISEEKLSLAEIHSGIESLRYGLIDDIGTLTTATEKAASIAGIRNYEVVKHYISKPFSAIFGFSSLADLKSQTGLMPIYYYLHFELE